MSTASLPWPYFSDAEIIAARPPRTSHDPLRPQAFFIEQEHSAAGTVDDVATLFLTNKECPFRCLMCDLWKGTLVESVPVGAIPAQIDFALDQLGTSLPNTGGQGWRVSRSPGEHLESTTGASLRPSPGHSQVRHIKLYNSGNFFDPQAIPVADYGPIADRVRNFETVIVENHPRLCRDDCLQFRDLLQQNAGRATLEIALGLETVHPQVLERLNKRMTLADVERATKFLQQHGIAMRAFILLRPPFLSEEQGIEWCLRSVEFAFEHGITCCSIIPVRAGNGIMDKLQTEGQFAPPSLAAVETVFDEALAIATGRGRVFLDTWGLEPSQSTIMNPESKILDLRHNRLQQMNLLQRILPRVSDHD